MSYNTNLKEWGEEGIEYPDLYSYQKEEQPIDEWDNFIQYNVIKDILHLIDTTNNDLVKRNGGELLGNLSVGSHRLLGDSGYVDFSGSDLTIDAMVQILQDLNVNGELYENGDRVASPAGDFAKMEGDIYVTDLDATDPTVNDGDLWFKYGN